MWFLTNNRLWHGDIMIIQMPPCTHEFLKDYANQLVFNKQQCLYYLHRIKAFCVLPAALCVYANLWQKGKKVKMWSIIQQEPLNILAST